MNKLHIADTAEVRAGDVTDVYFFRTEEVLLPSARHILDELMRYKKDTPPREFLGL